MRDFSGFVREPGARRLPCPPERERKIVEEWAAQLARFYDALRAEGLSRRRGLDASCSVRFPTGPPSATSLLDAEPVAARFAQHARRAGGRRTTRAVVSRVRESSPRDSPRPARAACGCSSRIRLQRHRHPDAGHLPRRQRRHLHRRARGAAAALARPASPIGSSASVTSTRPSRPTTSCRTTCPPISIASSASSDARRAGDVHLLVRHAAHRRHPAGDPRHAGHTVAVPGAARRTGAWADFYRAEGEIGAEHDDRPERLAVAATLRAAIQPWSGKTLRLGWTGDALHHRRRDAA